jgi:hypothetical protein
VVLLELAASGGDLGLPRRCAPPPSLRALCAARRPAPPAPSSPSRPRRHRPRPGRPAPEAGPAGPRPGTTTTGLETSGPRRGRQGHCIAPVPAEIGVEAVKGVVSIPGPALQILPPAGKAREDGVRESTNAEESERNNYETRRKTTNLEDAPRGTAVDPQCLVQRSVE